MLSDWAEILCQESHHPESKTFICFYSIDDNYFVSLNWAELYSKQMQVKLPHPFPPHSFFFFFFVFLYLAALGLCCWAQPFSSCDEWGLLSSCSEWLSH